jgi:hypothetical protein
MAHFAKIKDDNTVADVIVVANEVLVDQNGDEQESFGLEFIASLGLKGRWLQCSYNGSIRGSYPGFGFTYDEERDAFIPPQPYESWVLDEATYSWVAPIPYPGDGGTYTWNESEGDWVEVVGETT